MQTAAENFPLSKNARRKVGHHRKLQDRFRSDGSAQESSDATGSREVKRARGVVVHVPKGPVPDGYVPRGTHAEAVFFYLGIEVLAGEAEGIIERSAGFYRLAKRLISVVVLHCAFVIDD